MKKLLAIFLSLVMLLSLAACGGTTEPGSEPPVSTDPATEPSAEPSETSPVANATISTALWTLNYDDSFWVNDEESFSEYDDYACAILTVPNEDDYYDISLEIRVSLEDAENFRSYLSSYGFDAVTYTEGGYDLSNVGGVDCLVEEGNYWGEPCLRYFNRVEAAGATVMVEIVGDYEDPAVDALLKGLEFTLTDVGNVDFPWPWEGEPFSAEAHIVNVADLSLRSEWIPFEGGLVTEETFDHDIAMVGDRAYVLSDGVLHRYAYNGLELSLDIPPIETESEFLYVQADQNGLVWLSDFLEPLTAVQDGEVVATYEDMDYVAMHPTGTWGISWFSEPECRRFLLTQDGMITEQMNFEAVDSLSLVRIDEDYIYVCGTDDNWDHKVWVYDLDGALQYVLTDEEGGGLGSISYITHTANGFIALDGNMREVVLWDNDGNWLGTADDTELFGTNYPWFCGATMLEDGSLLILMTDDRADSSAMELVAFHLSGF